MQLNVSIFAWRLSLGLYTKVDLLHIEDESMKPKQNIEHVPGAYLFAETCIDFRVWKVCYLILLIRRTFLGFSYERLKEILKWY